MNRFAGIHQFHAGTALGDAITQQMLALQGTIRSLGYESEVFAEHVADGLSHRIRPIRDYNGSDNNLFLLHHSLGYDLFDEIISLPDEMVTIYHNVTPERYFPDESFRRLIRLGHTQLALLGRRSRLGIADSNFNRREMLRVGFTRVEVLPVRVDYSRFADNSGAVSKRTTDWLYVGRIVGNKCQHELVGAFARYARTLDEEARLLLIGSTPFPEYANQVRDEADRFGIADRVILFGNVSETQLKAAYSAAGVFVSLSEHEGFGVPILEAMAAGMPVVAYGAAALPETMGGAGILLRSKAPTLVAAVVQALRLDPDLRKRVIDRQLVRVQKVQGFDTNGLLTKVIGRAAGSRRPLTVQIQGPFETSYSLALVNRRLAKGFADLPDRVVSLYPTEGPGDYAPNPSDMADHPEVIGLFHRSDVTPYPDVVIRQMYPPRVIDSPGAITCEYFGWEESRIPQQYVEDFNHYLDGVGVMSSYVRDVLKDSGVDVPIRVVGLGVDPHIHDATIDAPELHGLKAYRFLNIGSGFPRKGLDVLLDAYFSVFNGSHDVTLILKTFPNPHNEVDALLRKLRAEHPNPPDVRWIDRDLPDLQVKGLYNLAHCYVHPARGEGFGLPVAEAMMAGVPVISLDYSGLAEFVSDKTAVTIPYRLEPAQTHFDLPGSMWAEPDGAELGLAMHRMTKGDNPDTLIRVQRAKQLISRHFSWEAVTARWNDFITELEDAAMRPSVALVTTWNSRCGVAENSRALVERARDLVDFQVFANLGTEILDPKHEDNTIRVWADRWNPDLSKLEDAIALFQPEIVHIQFNFGFFELTHLAAFMDKQQEQRAVVITLHRTRDIEINGTLVSLRSIAESLRSVDRVIVHQADDATVLADVGVTDNVCVVPIGTAEPPPVSPQEARAILGMDRRPVIGTFGFLLPHKGIHRFIPIVEALRAEFPDICLLALCARYPDPRSAAYEDQVINEIRLRGLSQHIVLVTDYLPDTAARAALRAADVIVLPYDESEESSSAALRFLLPVERPIVVTDRQIFRDCRDAVLPVDPDSNEAMEDAIRRVLTDPTLQEELVRRVTDSARKYRWSRVVADHREIYAAVRLARHRSHGR